MTSGGYDAVVLAGGSARRLGGVDKPALVVGERSLLDRALAAVAGAETVVVVGPQRELPAAVVQVREDPAGGGPAAALAAGLAHVRSDRVVVLAADLPHVTSRVVDALLLAADGRDGALLVDAGGRDQVLTGVWSAAALQHAAAGRDLSGKPLRVLLAGLDVARLPVGDLGLDGWTDCDTPADLAAARSRVRGAP